MGVAPQLESSVAECAAGAAFRVNTQDKVPFQGVFVYAESTFVFIFPDPISLLAMAFRLSHFHFQW